MVDKIRPLKMESALSGTELDAFPTEADPSEDYVSVKGTAYEGLDGYLSEKVGGLINHTIPSFVVAYTFTTGGEVNFIEYFSGISAVTANRIARVSATYDASFNLTKESWSIYNTSDGTSVVRNVVYSHVYSGVDLITSIVQTG